MPVKPIAPTLTDNLMRLADAYCAATGSSLKAVSRYATNDHRTLERLKDKELGASITVRKYDDAVAWFMKHWPAGKKRPALTNPTHWSRRAA